MILAAGAVVGVLCVVVAARLLSFWKILVLVGWAQVAFHFAFTVLASGPAHHAGAAPPPPPAGTAALGPAMLAGHLVAAVAAATLLAGADRALWWLLTAVFTIAIAHVRPISRPVAHRPPWAVLVAADPAPLLGVLLARAVRRRGPPAVRPHAAA
ncbi:hypothetical protein GCM10010411_13810 [Actinomadura fulvescens]|uniref:Integral membrane protein n=1 Tax=Actinomadura fulvescens TaxID=46160 RepID=A0ABN3PEY5_9ACTN